MYVLVIQGGRLVGYTCLRRFSGASCYFGHGSPESVGW